MGLGFGLLLKQKKISFQNSSSVSQMFSCFLSLSSLLDKFTSG